MQVPNLKYPSYANQCDSNNDLWTVDQNLDLGAPSL